MSSHPDEFYNDVEFDYRDYWVGRGYEDLAERQILQAFYRQVGHQDVLVDVGGGYGRLVSEYVQWAKHPILVEPSTKQIEQAQLLQKKWPHLNFIQCNVQNLSFQPESVDVVQMIRVAHHCVDLPGVISQLANVLKPSGWLILEIPNKIHGLMTFRHWAQGDWQFRQRQESIDRRAAQNRQAGTIPFFNHHPEQVWRWLTAAQLHIVRCASVSNFRRLRVLPLQWLVKIDRYGWGLTRPWWWGPSIFFLAQKVASSSKG